MYIYNIYIYIIIKHTLEMGFYNGTFYEILMGFKQQNGDLTGLSHFSHLYLGYKGTIMEFKTNKMTCGYLQKGVYTVYTQFMGT